MAILGKQNSKIMFCGGTGSVTGANFLFEVPDEKTGKVYRYLVDCGLEQGTKLADEDNWDTFPYDPKAIDILFITHAHIDHIGLIPKLINDGFIGRICSTEATRDLALPMLLDTVAILGHEKDHDVFKMYTDDNVRKAMNLWEGFPLHTKVPMDQDLTVIFRDSGHILGSAMVEFSRNGQKTLFTGDLGNSPSPILPDTEKITDIDFMVMESVYGDRNHENRDERKDRFQQVVMENYNRKGTLIIPTFSLERTQELLFEINDLVEKKKIPQMPIYLDSPLGIHLTAVYRNYTHYLNNNAQSLIRAGDDIFAFPGLKITLDTDASKQILHSANPKVIIAGSGMSNGGRILHHEQNYLPDVKNTILLVGYQSIGTLGRYIEEGARHVTIMGRDIPVRAHLEKISGYSGHKDSDHLVLFVEDAAPHLKKVFVTMGEPKSALFLAQRLRDELGVNALVPKDGETMEIPF